MKKQNHDKVKHNVKDLFRKIWLVSVILAIVAAALIYFVKDSNLSNEPDTEIVDMPVEVDFDKIENGIHLRTGFIDAPGMIETIQNCTNCHSSKLVIQNRMNAERWKSTIKWMQETQNLWELGENETVIINYLVTNYPPKKVGRRAALTDVEWYQLKE
ncbi:sulfite dehydrogenase (cytochrome) subunit SorB [Maribacter aquivivus]|uniref:Sulfite dehydrogenase (Cytochrome) subunit SorB n=1 Tax=Maribacter aquivivus TaxID=228958 RepID=A0A1M6Q226_9FLAO|nr:monoheme cytochrome C [Maribacter aquivivus]SHK14126.1 sulfite dehydrogenase (cytochrome) subunit SorB [Maribacter aquivivus]